MDYSDAHNSENNDNTQMDDDLLVLMNGNLDISYINSEDEIAPYLDEQLHFGIKDKALSDQPKDYQILYKLISKQLPLTIVLEKRYVDRTYRDSYYMYYSSKYKRYSRFCKRMTLFKGSIEQSDNLELVSADKMKESFMGSLVIRPLDEKRIGRSLLNPYYFIDDKEASYLKFCEYTIVVNGCSLSVNAFPYSMQDGETTTCAEITILNLTDYFSKKYQNYRFVLPSDIAKIEDRDGYERPLPSKGLRYSDISKVLSELGFSPRLFSTEMVQDPIQLKRIMHYYLESGIPVALGVKYRESRLHSIICVGHGRINKQKRAKRVFVDEGHSIWVTDTADLCDDYIVMDDCEEPYKHVKWEESSDSFETISGKYRLGNAELTTVVVPLYKRMFLEAEDAFRACMDYLNKLESALEIPLIDGSTKLGTKDNPLFVRFFMASSRHFKEKRLAGFKAANDDSLMYYTSVLFPKFVWVCEIYTEEGYINTPLKAKGEIVIDATASKLDKDKAIIVRFDKYISIVSSEDYEEPEDGVSSSGFSHADNRNFDEQGNSVILEHHRHVYELEQFDLIDSYDCNLRKPAKDID